MDEPTEGNLQASDVGKTFQWLASRFHAGRIEKTLIYYFSIGDEGWTITVGPDRCVVTPGKATEKADCFLKTSKEIFMKTFRGEYTPSLMDVVTGKVKTNDAQLLMVFKRIFE